MDYFHFDSGLRADPSQKTTIHQIHKNRISESKHITASIHNIDAVASEAHTARTKGINTLVSFGAPQKYSLFSRQFCYGHIM